MLKQLINFLKGLFMSEEEQEAAVAAAEQSVPQEPEQAPLEPAPAGTEQKAEQVTAAPVVEAATIEAAVAAAPVKVFYNGQEVVERFGLFDADGAQECKLADGTTTFVPKSVLGE